MAALAAFALGLAALAIFAPRGFLPWSGGGASSEKARGEDAVRPCVAVVIVDGALWGTFPLPEDGAREVLTVETPRGWNRIVLFRGTVAVEDADCPNRICQKQGAISRPGEVIACLPHKLLIEVRKAP